MGKPGRPRGDPYKIMTFNLREDVAKLIEEYSDKHKVPQKYIVQEAILAAFKGERNVILSLTSENESLRKKNKILEEENERLQREIVRLQEKIAKLEEENEKLREKNDTSRILEKFKSQADEVHQLAEEIKKHIREGRSWGETLEELGITDISARMEILHKLYSPRYVKLRAGFIEKNDILVSEVLSDYVLEKQGRGGYDSYVFKKRG